MPAMQAEIQKQFNTKKVDKKAEQHPRVLDQITEDEPENIVMNNMVKGTSLFSSILDNITPRKAVLTPNKFDYFATFQSSANSHVKVTILIPSIDSSQPQQSLIVQCEKNIKISDLIGLSCYLYTANKMTPPLKDVTFYELKIAIDKDEIEYELPALDMEKRYGDSDFSMLALVDISRHGEAECKVPVTVYLYNAKPIHFNVESYNVSLKIIRDKCLELARHDLLLDEVRFGMYKVKRYELETLAKAGESLDLSKTLGSCGTNEFVILRENSARGNFAKLMHKRQRNSSIETDIIVESTMSVPATPCDQNASSVFGDINDANSSSISPALTLYLADTKILASCPIDRVYKLKLNHSSYLEVKEHYVQISTQKNKPTLIIPWALLSNYEFAMKSEDKALFKVIYLKFSKSNTISGVNKARNVMQKISLRKRSFSLGSSSVPSLPVPLLNMGLFSLTYDKEFYEKNIEFAKWKTLNFEVQKNYIKSLSEIFNDLDSNFAARLYMHSSDTHLSPSHSWNLLRSIQTERDNARTDTLNNTLIEE
uniref:CRIM domain-containing protein n=1 Tax=Rhabditophanes sp. KR3021 TaxID=114890 RepID=A0AC35TIN6_9BILA